MRESSARPRKRQAANTPARSKCTILMDADTSRKLSVAADVRGMDRSELVNEVLRDALRWVVIQLRGQSTVSANPDGGGEAGATEAV